jgi:N-acylneuraminate cytidylyltransferase
MPFELKTVAFLPMRSGSKSIPDKNIKQIAGKPLFYWTLNPLVNAKLLDKIVVAVDSEKYSNLIKEYFNNPKIEIYFRDQANSQDGSSTEAVILEYIEKFKNQLKTRDNFLLVQATNPFIGRNDVDNIISDFNNKKGMYDSILSVSNLDDKFLWTTVNGDGPKVGMSINYEYLKRPRRQEFESNFYVENGAMYISTIETIFKYQNRLADKVGLYVMPSYTMHELDEPEDYEIIEMLLLKYKSSDFFNNGENLKYVKLFVCDIDGTLTDGKLYIDEKGQEQIVAFNKRDGKGFEILRNLDIKTIWITSEKNTSKSLEKRANKLKIDRLFTGVDDKVKVINDFCKENNIDIKTEVAYIGDDINCKDILSTVKYSFCPGDAEDEVKKIPNIYICNKEGGKGCVREVINLIRDAHEQKSFNSR